MSTSHINKKYPIIVAVDARMNEVYWVKYKNFSDIFSKNNIYNLTPENFLYKELEDFNGKEMNLIKNNSNIVHESADVVYHFLVTLESRGIKLNDVIQELKETKELLRQEGQDARNRKR